MNSTRICSMCPGQVKDIKIHHETDMYFLSNTAQLVCGGKQHYFKSM
jgi:hypothetical protein